MIRVQGLGFWVFIQGASLYQYQRRIVIRVQGLGFWVFIQAVPRGLLYISIKEGL
jgi:hypothetical protein